MTIGEINDWFAELDIRDQVELLQNHYSEIIGFTDVYNLWHYLDDDIKREIYNENHEIYW